MEDEFVEKHQCDDICKEFGCTENEMEKTLYFLSRDYAERCDCLGIIHPIDENEGGTDDY